MAEPSTEEFRLAEFDEWVGSKPHLSDAEFIEGIRDRFALLSRQNEELRNALTQIKKQGELACVGANDASYTGGKKPASKDVWQFPRHLLADIDAALSSTPSPSETEKSDG